jgi:hypothetical protein
MFLTRDQILNADDLKYEEMDVPEWGGLVRIKVMTGMERDDFEQSVFDMKGKDTKVNLKNFRAKLLVKTIVDDQGRRVFEESDIEGLSRKSSKVLDRIFNKAQEINGIGQKEVAELTGNSEASL